MIVNLDEMLTLREVASRLGSSYDEVWTLVQEGKIIGYRMGGQWGVPAREVDTYATRIGMPAAPA